MADEQNNSQERISQKLSPNGSTKSKRGLLVGITCLLVAVIAIVAVILIVSKQDVSVETRNALVTPENVDEVIEQMKDADRTPVGCYEVTMNTTWNFADGKSASTNAYVENSTSNQNDVYFDIIRSDSGETIYKSPTIPVGSHLENIALDQSLEPGKHDCVLTYHILDDSGKATSKLNINLEIDVEN